MSSGARETVEEIQRALEPRIRSREEVSHIRRVLCLHLLSTFENGPQPGALALSGADCTIKSTSGVRGLQRDYLRALHANIKAKRDQEAIRQANEEGKTVSARTLNDSDRLEEHVASIKLKKKQQRLQTIEKHLDLLGQKPAASPEFLQTEAIFEDVVQLPGVPKAVVSGFTVDKASAKTDLKALVDRLEKAVLRSKLLLKKEEKLLEEVRSRSTATRGTISDGAKLVALSATRNELISWMEAELGKASRLDDLQPEEVDGRRGTTADKGHVHEQLAIVKDKYANYVSTRKTLVQLLQQPTQPDIKPPLENTSHTQSKIAQTVPSTHLITPYIERLIQVGQDQRNLIAQKSHLNTVLSKKTEATVRVLDRLTEESQLIPEHPMPGSARRQKGLGADPPSDDIDSTTDRVQPWVFAADAAKLATLESVAEKIEAGQVALEKSTKSLTEIDQLLGRNVSPGDESAADEDTTVDDIWLAESASPRKAPKPNTHVRNKSNMVKEKGDIWSTLGGSVGLINAEDSPRKML
ncbi:hypothetical protein J7T55_008540 [Diaporthe amygdali]|uniref:uncharacterized protein n=1 Tax=Phomopsis amygdali TaxID=1214568 RepID=UPI0022FE6044|nr:uncharacterized protein J7T55_008540 [Diaporthe amygdali]KAJ0121376.1 hypothetical protein J7T55_008540 [Diaporthe amygdali]